MMNRIINLFIYQLVILVLVFPSKVESQCVFELTEVEDTTYLNSCWLYHPGDEMSWADPSYNDSLWEPMRTTMFFRDINDSIFSGIAWFRLHFNLNPNLEDTNLVLWIRQQGASEIFLDGKLIHRLGIIGTDSTEERVSNPREKPHVFNVRGQNPHLLAVRYSNQGAYHENKYYYENIAGFDIWVLKANEAINQLIAQNIALNIFIFLICVFLILGSLHFLLFLYYKKKWANFYYSIFSVLFAFMLFSVYLSNSPVHNPLVANRIGLALSMVLPFLLLPLNLILDTMILKRPSKVFWVLLAGAVITSLLYIITTGSTFYIFLSYMFLVFGEIIRKIIMALKRRIDGSRILGSGILFFVLFFITLILIIMFTGGFSLSDDDPGVIPAIILFIMAILSIPVTMSIYLARDFAVTNRNLARQLKEVRRLSALTLEQELEKKRILEGQKEKLEILVKERTSELEKEKDKTEELLHNILPHKVVKELKEKGTTDPEHFKNVTVYFSDIVGFTSQSGQLEPELLISELNEIFTAFDDIMVENGCERIKTIGDAYLAVCGMPDEDPEHAEKMARSAIRILKYLEERNRVSKVKWKIRIGIHSGDVVGSVVGVRKYIYDVFGDTINTAARMEQHSEVMRINVSPSTKNLLESYYRFTNRKPVDIKGKGVMEMYFLDT